MAHRPLRLMPAFALAFCLAGAPGLARAQDTGAAELKELELELRKEGIRRVVESIATRLAKTDAGKAVKVRAKAEISDAFASRHLGTADPEAMLKDLFKAELDTRLLKTTDLKFDLELHRSYKSAYRLKSMADKIPSEATGFSPPRSRGYPAEVAAIDNTAPHSMHDLRDYLADRFTNAALNRAVRKGYVVELHAGGETEVLSDLKNRGWKVLGEVKSVNGNYERLLVAQGPSGEIRYAITGTINGVDRVRHLSALLRFAGPDGKGIASDKIEIVGDMKALKENTYRELRDGLSRIGLKGDTAIIGFRMTLRNELLERALARRGAEYLRDVLGSDPYEGLKSKLRAERDAASGAKKTQLGSLLQKVEGDAKLAKGLKSAPEKVFTSIESLKALVNAQKTLVKLQAGSGSKVLESILADGKLRLPGGGSWKTATIARSIEFGSLKADELRVKESNGRTRSLRLVSNYYGDTMSGVVRALLDTGHTKLAYFGTAGGTGAGVKVGDIHVPEQIYDWKNELASGGMKNAFLEYFEGRTTLLGARLKTRTKLGNVYSPAVETMSWLEDVKTRGMHAIEVENSYIAREVARHNSSAAAGNKASLHTSVIISDVPGSEMTLGNSNGSTTATFEKMVDHYLEALGIKDLELVSKDQAKPATRPLARDEHRRRALEVADKLVPRNLPKSNFLRDRLAGIVGSLPLEKLNGIDTSNKLKPKDIPGLSEELKAELAAEVKGASTDAAMLTSLEKGNAVLSLMAKELAAKHPNASFELKVGGGLEKGSYSPVKGLTVEVAGDAAVKSSAAAALEAALAKVEKAPKVKLGAAGNDAVSLGKDAFKVETRPLVRELLARALTKRGANHMGTRVEYSGREHDPAAKDSELFSRYETYEVGPRASLSDLGKFAERVKKHGGSVEYIKSDDPRLRGGQGRTMLGTDGKPLVLLPKDKPVRRYALIDELTHVNQIDRMTRELGAKKVAEMFKNAQAGDPAALAKLVEWEIKAKRMVRLTLPADHPDRALLGREIDKLRKVLDPYLEARTASGRLNWTKVRAMAKTHAAGSASFLLGLFLKDLARVIQTGDKAIIGAFFDGLATTDFWKHYGLFVIGAEVGTIAYTRWLQRFVRPTFVNSVLKSNVALATGMALPELVRGKLDGKAFAVNFTGLMLSSAAVKAGLATLKWVVPLGRISRYKTMSRLLKVARGVPGWIYAGVETAVVLYFAEAVSGRINRWLEEKEMRRDVARDADALLKAVRSARGADDAALAKALEGTAISYTKWRDRSLRPAMDATGRLNDDMVKAGKAAAAVENGATRYESMAERYPSLRASVERLRAKNKKKVDTLIDQALARFERSRAAALRSAYHTGTRREAYDPVHSADKVSDNRAQAYDDEAALYEAAARRASSSEVREVLREWARVTREIKRRELKLLDGKSTGSTPSGSSGGARETLERTFR